MEGVPTLTVKLVGVELTPSVTWTVMTAVPCWLAAGVMVMLRFVPPPPNVMLAGLLGTSVVFPEVAVTGRVSAGGSASSTFNGRGGGGAFGRVRWWWGEEMDWG